MAQVVKLNPDEVKELRKINPALISYRGNVLEGVYTGTNCRVRAGSAT